MKNRVSQKEAIFYRLYQQFKGEEQEKYIPVHEFMGEVWVEELGRWGYVSYECSARLSEMYRENSELIERKTITGKSGAHYYGYRFTLAPGKAELIKDPALFAFYKLIKSKAKSHV